MEKTIQELINFSIINLDKPSGPTSFGVDVIVKKMLGLNKTSHAGTLDPQVTGVLPIMLGRACKLLGFFMHKNKKYAGIMRVHSDIEKSEIEKVIREKFLGKIMQTPPVKSRVKRQEREREVFSFDILEKDGKDFLFETEVEAGTYIRKLISDLGELINGAHMLELRRVKAGIFSEEENFVNLYELEDAVNSWRKGNEEKLRKILIPAEDAIKKVMPVVQVREKLVKRLLHGSPILKDFKVEVNFEEGERFAVFQKDKFIGVYRKANEKGILAKPEFVFN